MPSHLWVLPSMKPFKSEDEIKARGSIFLCTALGQLAGIRWNSDQKTWSWHAGFLEDGGECQTLDVAIAQAEHAVIDLHTRSLMSLESLKEAVSNDRGNEPESTMTAFQDLMSFEPDPGNDAA